MRQGKLKITSPLLTATLSAVDQLKTLLNEGDMVSDETMAESLRITEQVNSFIAGTAKVGEE